MTRSTWAIFSIFIALAIGSTADDTARFNGQWKATVPFNGQTLTLISIHDGATLKNYVLIPTGAMPIGAGSFSAADGKWTATTDKGNDSGTYQFLDNDTITGNNSAGQTVVWHRDNTPLPQIIGAQPAAPAPPAPPADAGINLATVLGTAPAEDVAPDVKADIQTKMQAKDYDGVLQILNTQPHPPGVPIPFLDITHAAVMLQIENYRQARNEMSFFLQRRFDNPDAYITHAQACAALGDQRWADRDLQIAAQLRPATADADRKSVAVYAAIDPPGFTAAELPTQLDELLKMSANHEPFDSLVHQAMRIVKGEYNIRRVEWDEYRDRKRQLVAAAIADPRNPQPLVDLASFLCDQADSIHGNIQTRAGLTSYRLANPDAEHQETIVCANAALSIDSRNAKAMACRADAMIALGDEDQASQVINQALAINPNEPELLRMFSQLATRSASANSDAGDQMSMPTVWEDDEYTYMRTRSDSDLAQARAFNAAADQENDNAATALQSAVDNTKGTAAGFYYQAIQCIRRNDNPGGAAAMEQAVNLAPDNTEYRDLLAHFYSKMGRRNETGFFTQWSIADNMRETSAEKMIRLAWLQILRRDYDPARQTLAEAMRIDPADPRALAYMGLLIAGENQDRAQVDQTVNWLMAAEALEVANLRLWGLDYPTPNIMNGSARVGFEYGLAMSTGQRLLALNRPQEAAMLALRALNDAKHVDKARWPYEVFLAMLPIPSLQKPPAPHMDPLFNPHPDNTTTWVIRLHELAGNALKASGQNDQASQEYAAAQDLQQTMQNLQNNAPPPPMRR